MEILFGIILMALAAVIAFCVSPILIMAGVMGASDDPNASKIAKFIGLLVVLAAVLGPIAMFITGIVLIV